MRHKRYKLQTSGAKVTLYARVSGKWVDTPARHTYMPTQRFVVIPAPLEERVAASVATRVQGAMTEALRLKQEVNATIHRDDFGNRAVDALQHVARPGGLPFVLFMLLIAVVCVRELLLRMETKRILKAHQELSGSPEMPSKHEHDD